MAESDTGSSPTVTRPPGWVFPVCATVAILAGLATLATPHTLVGLQLLAIAGPLVALVVWG